MLTKILIIGSGGGEHAIAKKLAHSDNTELYYAGRHNPGLDKFAARLADELLSELIKHAQGLRINMVIVGPEKPLADGYVDKFQQVGIPCIGPKQVNARVETSKIYARQLMTQFGLAQYCPHYVVFTSGDTTYKELLQRSHRNEYQYVIKPDGSHGGKGVQVLGDHFETQEEALNYCQQLEAEGFVIEEKMVGEEFSLMTLSDGLHTKHLIPVKDYKRLLPGDKGPNTESMGSITGPDNKLWFLSDNDIQKCQLINDRMLDILYKNTGVQYRGVLCGAFIKTKDGDIKVLKFNARFGDPECVNIMELLETDLVDIMWAMVKQKLHTVELKWSTKASVFKYMVPHGYPQNPVHNGRVNLPPHINNYIMADISFVGDHYVENGSRTLGYICAYDNLQGASDYVNERLRLVEGPLHFRDDIGQLIFGMMYVDTDVNIEEGNKVVTDIRESVVSTYNDLVLKNFGDFGGCMRLPPCKKPILVSSTDGVGTKSILVVEKYGCAEGFRMLGRDLVNHCVNDILVKGAQPLYFLDYFASSKIRACDVAYFVEGVAEACVANGCVLLGGKTAEIQDVYVEGRHDFVGTMVGIVEEDQLINAKKNIQSGDIVLSLPSSGPHTNGYSLIRKMVKHLENRGETLDFETIDALCATHKSYLMDYQTLVNNKVEIHGMCHITSGGLIDNPPHMLPEGTTIQWKNLQWSPIFGFIQKMCELDDEELMRTFNCGHGMLIVVPAGSLFLLTENDLQFQVVGQIEKN